MGLVIVGIVLVAIAVGLRFVAGRSADRGAGLAAAPTLQVKDLADVGAMGTALVEVVGSAVACGPELRTPIGQTACAWYESTTYELYRERVTTGTGSNRRSRMEDRERQVSCNRSSSPIGIDDGTGVVQVDLDGCDIDRAVVAMDQRVDDRSDGSLAGEFLRGALSGGEGTYGHRQVERVLPVGQRLFAIGAAAVGPDGPRLIKPTTKGQPFMVSTRDEAQLSKSAATSQRWWTVAAVAAGVLGLVAIVAGLVS